MKNVLLLLLLSPFGFLTSQSVKKTAGGAPKLVTSVEGVNEYSLPNGLQVLLVPDAAQSNVVVNVVYHVGSRNEGYGETGMAHLLEHMLFKGSTRFSDIKKIIAAKGATANGTTWYDRTDYFEILPATDENLSWSLDMESDRMTHSTMRNEDLQKEFTVVRNEFEMGENSPEAILDERIFATMFLWHNYGKSTIGSKTDIEKVPIGNLKAFYTKYYQPDNATLLVGGKFDQKKTLALIAKYFGAIPKPTRVIQPSYTIEPPQDGERYVELRRNGDEQYLGLAYHSPSFADSDYAANAAAINVLTNDPAGIFYKALVETKLATAVSGSAYILHDPGMTNFTVTVPATRNLDSVKTVLLKTADALPATKVSDEDLERAKNALMKNYSDIQNNVIGFCINQAEYIGAGDWRLFYLARDRTEKLTAAQVEAALKKYYLTSNRTVGAFIPDKNAQRTVVSDPPNLKTLLADYKGQSVNASSEAFAATISNIKQHTQYGSLPNGMQYALLKKPVKGDKVFAHMILKTGTEQSLMGKNTVAELTAEMLKNGTINRSKKAIADALNKNKTDLNFSSLRGSIFVDLSTDKAHIDSALAILADVLLHPSFDPNEFDKTVLELKSRYEAHRTDPQFVAFNDVTRKVAPYPKGHPLYTATIDEKISDLQNAKVDDLKSFYKSFYGVNHGFAAFAGAIEPEAIKNFLSKNFESFTAAEKQADIEEKYFENKGSTDVAQINDKSNAVAFGAINVPLKQTDPDYAAVDFANEMLGGGSFLGSRIPQRLREAEGMSYGAGSSLVSSYKYQAARWRVFAIFNPIFKNRLDSALREELTKAATQGFKPDELKSSLSGWLQQSKVDLGDDDGLCARIVSYMSQGKDLQYYEDYENKFKSLTVDQVNAALKKYIKPENLVIEYAGDFNKK